MYIKNDKLDLKKLDKLLKKHSTTKNITINNKTMPIIKELKSKQIKDLRRRLQVLINALNGHIRSRELEFVKDRLQEAKMWAGMELANFDDNRDLNKERDDKEAVRDNIWDN